MPHRLGNRRSVDDTFTREGVEYFGQLVKERKARK